MKTPPRRVVTGHDDLGRSVVLMDTGPGNSFSNSVLAITTYEMWATDESPAPVLRVPFDPSGRPVRIQPQPCGTVFRIADFEPDPSIGEATDGLRKRAEAAFRQIQPEASQWRPGVHPGMHRTATFDYVVVLEGTIDLVLDSGEVRLEAGDVLIQSGTNHAWANRSGAICRVAFILVDATFDALLAKQWHVRQEG